MALQLQMINHISHYNMKYIKAIFIILIFTFSLSVSASYGLSKNTLKKIKPAVPQVSLAERNNATTKNELPLNDDVWFAFAAIGVLGGYVVFKR